MRRRAAGAPIGAVALVLLLAGCGARQELDGSTQAVLQDGVLAVTEAAAAGRYDVAEAELVEVRTDLEAAVDAGQVTATRYRLIDDALDRATVELTAARDALAAEQAAAQAAAEQAAAEQAAAEQAAAEQAAAEQAAAEQAAAEQAAAQQGGGGKGGEGKGNGKGDKDD